MSRPESLTVLLVEDDPTDTALFRALLGHTPRFVQRHADCLADAVSVLGSEEIGAVVLDLGLPDSDPSETYQRVRDADPLVPVIVLTGHDDDSLAFDALAQGAQDYLVKTEVTEALLAKAIFYSVERQRSVSRQLRQRLQELEAFEALAPATLPGDESGLAESSPDVFDDLVLTYDHLLDRSLEVSDDAGVVELSAGLDGLAIRLAELRATPPDLAIVHVSALSRRQATFGPEEFRTHEDAARLLLLRLTGALANRYRGRAEASGAGGGQEEVELLRREFAHQLQTARQVLAADRWPEASLTELMESLVQSLVELWQGARSITARAVASAAGGTDAAHDLRYGYLRELINRSVDLLGRDIDLSSEELRRPTALALAELFAVLDQKLLLGELYPHEQTKDEAIRELAERTLSRLPLLQAYRGTPTEMVVPEVSTAPEPSPAPPAPRAPAAAAPSLAEGTGTGGRRLTEADYAAWANRMRSRRREEILSNMEPEPVEEETSVPWDPKALFRDSD